MCSDNKIKEKTPCGCMEGSIFNGGITILDYLSLCKLWVNNDYTKVYVLPSYTDKEEHFADVINIEGDILTAKVIETNIFGGTIFKFQL